jgi:hypothetical protein
VPSESPAKTTYPQTSGSAASAAGRRASTRRTTAGIIRSTAAISVARTRPSAATCSPLTLRTWARPLRAKRSSHSAPSSDRTPAASAHTSAASSARRRWSRVQRPKRSRRSATQRRQGSGEERGTREPGTTRPEVESPRARAARPTSYWPQESGPRSAWSSALSRTRWPAAGGMPESFHHTRVRARAATPSTRETSSTPRPPRASTSTDASRPSSKTGVPVGSEVARSAREARNEPVSTAETRRARCAPGRRHTTRPPVARRTARQANSAGAGRTRAGSALPMPSARTGKTSGRVPRSFQLQSRIVPPPGLPDHRDCRRPAGSELQNLRPEPVSATPQTPRSR